MRFAVIKRIKFNTPNTLQNQSIKKLKNYAYTEEFANEILKEYRDK